MSPVKREVLRAQILANFTHKQICELEAYITEQIGKPVTDRMKEYDTKDIQVRDLFYLAALKTVEVPWETVGKEVPLGYQEATYGPIEELPGIVADSRYLLSVRAIASWRLSVCADHGSNHRPAVDGGQG